MQASPRWLLLLLSGLLRLLLLLLRCHLLDLADRSLPWLLEGLSRPSRLLGLAGLLRLLRLLRRCHLLDLADR
jgi:hypothetical protein